MSVEQVVSKDVEKDDEILAPEKKPKKDKKEKKEPVFVGYNAVTGEKVFE